MGDPGLDKFNALQCWSGPECMGFWYKYRTSVYMGGFLSFFPSDASFGNMPLIKVGSAGYVNNIDQKSVPEIRREIRTLLKNQ